MENKIKWNCIDPWWEIGMDKDFKKWIKEAIKRYK